MMRTTRIVGAVPLALEVLGGALVLFGLYRWLGDTATLIIGGIVAVLLGVLMEQPRGGDNGTGPATAPSGATDPAEPDPSATQTHDQYGRIDAED